MLVPYLPRLVVDWYAEEPERRWRNVEGTLAFVDISGFTALSERLARRGKIGAEELADTINHCFQHLLGIAYANDGRLLKFGGDALLLLFTGDDHAVRACRAAVEMRRALRHVGRLTVSGNRVVLRMSVGVHTGVFDLFLVGASHREFIVTGPAASTTVLMEGTAEAGDVLVSADTAAHLPTGVLGERKGDGWLLAKAPDGPPTALSAGPMAPGVDLDRCVPVALRTSLRAGSRHPEHRRVTVAFLRYEGTDAVIRDGGPEEAAARLDALVFEVQEAADHHDVAFLATDIDRNGGKIILTAGAPFASGDDERRMLLALRQIHERVWSLPVRIGVNRGDVFAGDIGPSYRRTYTVMGDTVNLAARVMAKAEPGQLLATGGVLQRSATVFDTVALEPFFVKGKSQPVAAFSVGRPAGGKVTAPTNGLPLVGRDAELTRLADLVRHVRSRQGALVEVVGDAGVGKSRLVDEMLAAASDLVVVNAVCEPYETATPYHPFTRPFRDLLGIPEDAPDEDAAVRLGARLTALAPALLPWLPLIAATLGISMPDTPETANLEERFRAERLAVSVGDLLGVLLPSPTILVVQDAHWMDTASAELLARLAEGVERAPWLICVTRRPGDGVFVADPQQAVSIRLGPLDPHAAAALLHSATGAAPLPPHQIEALAERSGGNPLFLTELVAAVGSDGDLEGLPDTVEALIASRIDRLAVDDRNLLRRLSVLGGAFAADLLAAVVDVVPGPDDDVWNRLSGFLGRDADGNVSFDHALVRDGAYEGLPYRLRRELHGRVADVIRRDAGDDPEEHASLLSLHYLHAQRFPDAWTFARIAAERAKALFANVDAAELYERALRAASSVPGIDRAEVARVHEALGDVRNRVGTYASAERAYKAARRLTRDDRVAQSRLLLKLAWVHGWMDRYSHALRLITNGLTLLTGVDGAEAGRQRAHLLAWYGRFRVEQGRPHEAISWCERAAAEADAAGEDEALAHALRVAAWARMELGELDDRAQLLRALELYRRIDDLAGEGTVLNLLGGLAYWRGEWAEALDSYERAGEALSRTGNTVMRAFCTSNVAEIALDQGRLDEAEKLFDEALRVWRASAYRSGVAYAKCHLARIAALRGDNETATVLFGESLAEHEDIGSLAEAIETSARIAEFHLLAGERDAALRTADETLERARLLGGIAAQTPLLHRVRGAVLLARGELDGASRSLDDSLTAALARRADYEAALTLAVQADLERARGDDQAAEILAAQSQAVLDRLGVIVAPALVR